MRDDELKSEEMDLEAQEMNALKVELESEMSREETAKEMGDRLQKDADDFKEEISHVESEDELKKMEEEVVKKLNAFDDILKSRSYTLPEDVEFDGKKFTRKQIATKIAYFINKKDVQWTLVLGMWQLYKFWTASEIPEDITYGAYDSTLQTLGGVQFAGNHEWRDILAINQYFAQCNDRYAKDSTILIWLSTKHNHILDRMQMITKIDE